MPRNSNFAMQWLLNFACNEPTECEVRVALKTAALACKIVSPKMTADALEEGMLLSMWACCRSG